MRKATKAIAVVASLMLLLAALTTFFRVVMPPEKDAEKSQEQLSIEAKDPLKTIGGDPEHWDFPAFDFPSIKGDFNWVFTERIIIAWFVIVLLLIFTFFARRGLSLEKPSRIQVVAESIIGFFNDICRDTMGKEHGRKIFPLVITLFLFIFLCNYIGLLPLFFHFFATVVAMGLSIFDSSIVWIREGLSFPNWVIQLPEGHWLGWFARMPKFEEPTADLNTTLGCGLIVITYVHSKAIRVKGLWGYIKSYFHPVFFFFPLNVIGEAAKGVSLSFRLFGNILGGSIVILVLSALLYQSGLVFLNQTLGVWLILQGFLTLLVGAVQAFVFAMLALTYTAVMVED